MLQKVKLTRFCSFAVLASVLFACNPAKRINKDYNYFQKGLDSALTSAKFKEPTIVAGDNITIQVVAGSLSQQDASLFNLSSGSTASSPTNATSAGPVSSGANYLVDKDGNITMPKIGKIKVEGFTKQEISNIITKKLGEAEFVKDPLVVVKLAQFRVNVLGEVKKPGTVIFKTEKTNILEVIAEAGDLTDFGKREDVVVMRQEKDKWVTYKLNLKNTDFFKSEGFYLKNNDVVYVGANDRKLKTVNINPNIQTDISIAATALQTLFFVLQAVLIIRSFR
ncbi:MAG: polysaccharide biosynthesis/export family protein [Chitinophagaceae bacterium]